VLTLVVRQYFAVLADVISGLVVKKIALRLFANFAILIS
jgi:hypothetical protein